MDRIANKRKIKMTNSKKIEFIPPSRSTKYNSEYAHELYEWLCQGFSFNTFSVEGVCHATLVNWVNTNAEFRHALIEGQKKRRLIVEAAGLNMLKQGNSSVWKTMIAEYQTTERVEMNVKEDVVETGDSITPKKLERLARIERLMSEVKEENTDIIEVESEEVEDFDFL